MSDVARIFDRDVVRRHRDRAAATLADHDFLLREVAARMAERLLDITRDFPLALDLGGRDGTMARATDPQAGVGQWIVTDLSLAMLRQASLTGVGANDGANVVAGVVADEEWLPFAPHSFDLVTSCLNLHWVNDLPGTLIQIRRALKPDRPFLATVFGTETLRELRQCLAEAEISQEGGMSPRVSPMMDTKTAGALLQRAGFVGAVADSELITVNYRDPLRLLRDLRGMGETNAVRERRKTLTRRATLFDALGRYREGFGIKEAGPETDAVTATFEIITLTAWSPADPGHDIG